MQSANREAANHRQSFLSVKIGKAIRKQALPMEVDPALAPRYGEKAAAELGSIRDSEASRTADEAPTRSAPGNVTGR